MAINEGLKEIGSKMIDLVGGCKKRWHRGYFDQITHATILP